MSDSEHSGDERFLNRRSLLQASGLVTAGLIGARLGQSEDARHQGTQVASPQPEPDSTPDTPEAALARLYAGNQRFIADETVALHRDLRRVKQIAPKQTPFAAFLGCADSRVPIEFIFDQGFGNLFVSRIAGNIASSEIIGSLEFGTQVLGAKVIYVLGHSACGAVAATIKGQEVPGQISGLFQFIRPAVRNVQGDIERGVSENVLYQAELIAEASPVLSRMIQRRELIVAGGVYDLQTGRVTPVPLTTF